MRELGRFIKHQSKPAKFREYAKIVGIMSVITIAICFNSVFKEEAI
jgi:hypothetical protein